MFLTNLLIPNLFKFFDDLEVAYEKSDMSFAVSVKDSIVEYGGKGLKALFANKLNIFNPKFLKMVSEIMSFYKNAPLLLNNNIDNETLGSYLEKSQKIKIFYKLSYYSNGSCNLVYAFFKS